MFLTPHNRSSILGQVDYIIMKSRRRHINSRAMYHMIQYNTYFNTLLCGPGCVGHQESNQEIWINLHKHRHVLVVRVNLKFPVLPLRT